MKSNRRRECGVVALVSALAILAGCNSAGKSAADLGLAGAGGVTGYYVSNRNIGGAAAGAALGYLGSRVAQSAVRHETADAEKRGFDRAMNQAVKQQYWMIQERQREQQNTTTGVQPRFVRVVIPESKVNGAIRTAHVEYLRVE